MDCHDRLPPPNPDKAATMRRFDDLPTDARRAMSSAAFQFHPQAAEKLLARGIPGPRVGEMLTASDPGICKRTEGRKWQD
ncbi:hypothetical protein RMS29_028410 (plasmid) [Agrobacterium rosae]|uniref:hypothetical protein n=1 Tax=Agrobacterium rosae TaxID=1972867 RepID=UPI003D794861